MVASKLGALGGSSEGPRAGVTPPDGYVTARFREDFPGGHVPVRHVLGSALLHARRTETEDLSRAFCEHYALITEGYDAAHAEGRLPDQQFIDGLPSKVEPDGFGALGGVCNPHNYVNVLRAALLPHYGHGVTMTDLADRTDKPIEDIVSALYAYGVSDAVYYAAVEDAIVARLYEPHRRLAEELGVGRKLVHHFTKLHRSPACTPSA